MNLAQADERRKRALAPRNRLNESATIALDKFALVRCRETKVKLRTAIGFRKAAHARAETMNQV